MPATILSVDSGLGGLSVVEEIRRLIPGQRHVYVCDNAYYPYGLRQEADLLQHFLAIMKPAISACSPNVIVVACNTISTICLPKLRALTSAPVVGVVPAIKPAAMASKRRVIGLLATPATIERPYTDQLIAEFAGGCRVIRVGSAALVEMAENKLRGILPDQVAIARILAPFLDGKADERPDVIVLACTHFPLLREELMASGPRNARWIDSGEAIARRVKDILSKAGGTANAPGPDLAFVTGRCDEGLKAALRRFGFPAIEALPEQ